MPKYVLTGATGGLGSHVLKYLLKLVPASDIIVSLYNPAGASAFLRESGVEIRRGDYADPASLDAAFAGADRLLLVSFPRITPEVPVENHKRAIDAARRVGIKHIFYTSLAVAMDSAATVVHAQPITEAYLKASGLTYTIVREGIYSDTFFIYLGGFDGKSGASEVVVPYSDGRIAFVSREELGEATAKILAADSGYENQTVLLTGQRSYSLSETAALMSGLLKRDISLKFGTVDEFVQTRHFGPQATEEFLRNWASCHLSIERGEFDVVDPTLPKILGRPPKPFEETMKEVLIPQAD